MQQEVIIITGTSSGIGFGLAKYYLEQGNIVIGMSRRVNEQLSNHLNYEHLQIDITNQEAVKKAFADFKDRETRIKLLVLNAGVLGEIKYLETIEIDAAKQVMEINVWANKLILDELIKQKIECSQVIAISSGAARNGNAGWGPYSISKAALNILIQTYAAEQTNIHFTAVAPGLVDTAMQDYISSVKSVDKFPSLPFLQAAKGTDAMPDPMTLAPRLARLFEKAYTQVRSGNFIDIRD
jgi:NAD(P)-dependent dehydrogenase (short-subunit alcohol dehydrogenase family)